MPRQYRVYCITETQDVFVTATSAPTVCPNNASHTINANSISIVDPLLSAGLVYQDGSDGDVTISANTSLARDMYYRNLTITSGAVLSPSGFRVFVSDTLNITNGSISANGNNGSGTTAGAVPYTTAFIGTGSSGGAGGSSASSNGVNGLALSANTRMGGLGGSGGNGSGSTGGPGGTGTIALSSNGGPNPWIIPQLAEWARGIGLTQLTGGSGGGGGGGDLGGGGGSGAGIILLFARLIVWTTASITANGGNGANSTGSNGGGGGSGGGGFVLVVRSNDITGLTVTANAGVPGSKTGLGFNGTAGSAGVVTTIMM